ncbi:MAG: hypothetical protein AAFX93_19995 [Verrucomicrobiota bacterium]
MAKQAIDKPTAQEARWQAWGQARQILDLLDIARDAGIDLRGSRERTEPSAGVRVFSPFRDDGKTPHFLLCGAEDGGRRGRVVGAKDLSTGETWDLLAFAVAAWGCEKLEARDRLLTLAGVNWESFVRGDKGKRIGNGARRRLERERNRAAVSRVLDRARSAANAPLPEVMPVESLPDFLQAHYRAGWEWASKWGAAMAHERGWPGHWAHELIEAGKVSAPMLPWEARDWDDRAWHESLVGLAFAVEVPQWTASYDSLTWCWTGYHQRFFRRDLSKSWMYLPALFEATRPRNDFQRKVKAHGRRIEAAPFVMGDPVDADLFVLCEGQWDAITAWGALGGFDDSLRASTCVLGLRGAQGVEPFLRHYGWVLDRKRPRVLMLPDNDTAGDLWKGRPADFKAGKPAVAGLVDRMRKLVGHDRVGLWELGERGDDFNDWWTATQPSTAQLWERIRSDY